MKNLYTSFALPGLILLAGCSDDKTSAPLSQIKDQTYTDATGLQLYYNGQDMPDKTASFFQNGDRAQLKVYSSFDLSQLTGLGLTGEVPGPGVLPGTPELRLDVPVAQADGYWTFTQDGSTDYCTFTCSGYVSGKEMKLYFDNVKLKSGGLTPSVWSPAPIVKDSEGNYTSLPFYIDWQYDPLPEVDINLTPIIEALTVMPIIPVYHNTAYMSISEALREVIKTVAFKDDGNVVFSYVSTAFGAAQLMQSRPNSYQYVITSPIEAKFYANPMSLLGAILVNTSGGIPESDVDIIGNGMYPSGGNDPRQPDGEQSAALSDFLKSEIGQQLVKSVMDVVVPQLSEGIPMKMSANADHLDIFVDTDMAVNLAQKILLPLLQDDSTVKLISDYLKSHPVLSQFYPDVEKILPLIPKALERTTLFRVGFAFTPYNDDVD